MLRSIPSVNLFGNKMKFNEKKNKNKDTVTKQDMIIFGLLCLNFQLCYLLGHYLGCTCPIACELRPL